MATCHRCGKCCMYLEFEGVGKILPATKQFYSVRGVKVIETRSRYFVQVPHRCPHLTEDNLCGIQEKKPFACKAWGSRKMLSSYPGYPEGCAFNS